MIKILIIAALVVLVLLIINRYQSSASMYYYQLPVRNVRSVEDCILNCSRNQNGQRYNEQGCQECNNNPQLEFVLPVNQYEQMDFSKEIQNQ